MMKQLCQGWPLLRLCRYCGGKHWDNECPSGVKREARVYMAEVLDSDLNAEDLEILEAFETFSDGEKN